MIRFIHCVRKRDDVSLEEFRRYWQSPEFEELIRRVAGMFNARCYAKNATLAVDANQWIREMRNSGEPFDGVIEYWVDNAARFMEIVASEPYHVLRTKMELFQYKFIDPEKSFLFFTEGVQVECR